MSDLPDTCFFLFNPGGPSGLQSNTTTAILPVATGKFSVPGIAISLPAHPAGRSENRSGSRGHGSRHRADRPADLFGFAHNSRQVLLI